MIMEPVDRDWGGRSGYFADPEGNRWEVAWAPGMEFDDRGAVTGFGRVDSPRRDRRSRASRRR